ncbi:homeobox protein HMX2 isoform X1 [Choloepus didactylus]|uniref:homeobox protein HMX2 isoform X1 n=1 Tax=Choloepus didactylus TaxID=27675 RepID=UPI00189E54EF|nr:homeobox protein HMX2 isoform X1 [Choloepus didactylus]
MGSKEDAGKGCPAAGGVSSFTIQSILGGGPSEAPRESVGWPARKRPLSVSSEEEEPDDGWKAPSCFCPDPHGPKEPSPKHHPPIPFPCLGKDRTQHTRRQARAKGGRLRAPPGISRRAPSGRSRGARGLWPRGGDAGALMPPPLFPPGGGSGGDREHRPCEAVLGGRRVGGQLGRVEGEWTTASWAPWRLSLNIRFVHGYFLAGHESVLSSVFPFPDLSLPQNLFLHLFCLSPCSLSLFLSRAFPVAPSLAEFLSPRNGKHSKMIDNGAFQRWFLRRAPRYVLSVISEQTAREMMPPYKARGTLPAQLLQSKNHPLK